MNSPRQKTPVLSHCKGQTGTWPPKAVKKEQKVHQEMLVCLSVPPSPSTALTCTSCCSSGNLRKQICCGEETSPLTLMRGEGNSHHLTWELFLKQERKHLENILPSSWSSWNHGSWRLTKGLTLLPLQDTKGYLLLSAQPSFTEPPKEKESKSHTVICHADSQVSISDVPGIKARLRVRSIT